MPQRETRPIGGIYRAGPVIATGGILTISTAYNHNTNDVVGLYIIELQSLLQQQMAPQLLQALEKRRLIQSPHVLRVHNWGIDGNRIYIATDPPRGLTLQHILNNENIDTPRAIDLARQLAIGLKAFHEQTLSALDLRPQLITVDTIGIVDRVQIDDIGLRPLLLSLGYVSNQRGDDIGYLDPRYAPPEYIQRGSVGPWSDIYQLGLLFYLFITGRVPFVGRTPAETGILQSTSPIPALKQYKHDAPTVLQALLERMLEKDKAYRFASADAFLAALNAIALPGRTDQHGNPLQDKDSIQHQPSISLTKEMPLVNDDDTILRVSHPQKAIPDQTSSEKPVPDVPTAGGTFAYLGYKKDGEPERRFALTSKSTIVGRLDPKRNISPDLDLSTVDPTMTISRQHARIRFEGAFFYIEDLKSRNKTRLGDLVLTPLQAELLQHGDIIQFGSVRITFEIPGMDKVHTLEDQQHI